MTSGNSKHAARVALLAVLAATMSGCGTEYLRRDDTLATYSGDAVRRNIAIQTINPNPDHAYRNHIHTSGARLEGAMARYSGGETETVASDTTVETSSTDPQTPDAGQEPQ